MLHTRRVRKLVQTVGPIPNHCYETVVACALVLTAFVLAVCV